MSSQLERVILLVDMDCFYCQVEEQLDHSLKGQPMAVVQYNQWRGGGIIAVNYEARNRGVTRHMRGCDAQKTCPEIKLVSVPSVRGKADLTKYRNAGKTVAKVLQRFTPLLERASVDEAYLDISELVVTRMLTFTKEVQLSLLKNTHVVGGETVDFLYNLYSSELTSESNLRLCHGAVIAEEIRAAVLAETGYTCSAGISHNKILAKLACGLNKPNKQTILTMASVESLYADLPIRKIRSLGGKFGETLSEDLGISRMCELAKFSERELAKKYDEKTGSFLYNIARGIDLEPVTTRLVPKSIGCCKQFTGKAALTSPESVQHWLHELALEIVERLEQDYDENSRRAKNMIVSFAHKVDGKTVSGTRTHPLKAYDVQWIVRDAFEVIKKNCMSKSAFAISLLGVNAGKFEDCKNVADITSFFTVASSMTKIKEKSEQQHKMTICRENNLSGNRNDDIVLTTNDSFMGDFSDSTVDLNEDLSKTAIYEEETEVSESDSISEEMHDETSLQHKEAEEDPERDSFFLRYFRNMRRRNKGDMSSPVERNFNTSLSLNEVFNDEMCSNEEPSMERQIVKSEEIEMRVVCDECGKSIPVMEAVAHSDYHFAQKLLREDREQQQKLQQQQQQTRIANKSASMKTTGGRKRKLSTLDSSSGGNKNSPAVLTLDKFFSRPTSMESLENEGHAKVCSECNKKVAASEFLSHLDYHAAKKLHLEINAMTTELSHPASCQQKKKQPVGDGRKKVGSIGSVLSYFNNSTNKTG